MYTYTYVCMYIIDLILHYKILKFYQIEYLKKKYFFIMYIIMFKRIKKFDITK